MTKIILAGHSTLNLKIFEDYLKHRSKGAGMIYIAPANGAQGWTIQGEESKSCGV